MYLAFNKIIKVYGYLCDLFIKDSNNATLVNFTEQEISTKLYNNR